MITTGSKFFYGLATLALIATGAYGWGSRGGLNGVLTMGLSGGIGEHAGYTMLLFVGAVALLLGGLSTAFRDADADAVAAVAHTETVPEVPAPRTNNFWPAFGALAAACVVLGLVISAQLFVLGLIIGIVVLLEWMVAAWADRATGDAEVNRRIRNRIMLPFEIPIFAAVGLIGVVFGSSRVLLALTKNGSAIFAIVAATLILIAGFVVVEAPKKAARGLATALILVGVAGILVGGVMGAASGSREFHPHEVHESEPQAPDRRQTIDPSAVSAEHTESTETDSSAGH